MHDTRPLLLHSDFPPVHRGSLETLQVNLGYLCNLSCVHCHVNAGPQRTELMDLETVDQVLSVIDAITAEELRKLAKETLVSEGLRLAVVGPVDPDEPLEDLLVL